jgi:hypothetical protein
MQEYGKKLGEMWRELSEAEKKPYNVSGNNISDTEHRCSSACASRCRHPDCCKHTGSTAQRRPHRVLQAHWRQCSAQAAQQCLLVIRIRPSNISAHVANWSAVVTFHFRHTCAGHGGC